MVTKYSGYIHTPATRATGYVEDPNGSVVLASDYAALDEALNECIKDRDWFSDRLDAATAELARVKAESLRVVKVGDPCALGVCRESHFLTGVSDILSCADEFVIEMYGDQIVQPVRLERWEATDVLGA